MKGKWPIYYDRKLIGFYEGNIEANDAFRSCTVLAARSYPLLGEVISKAQIYNIVFTMLYDLESKLTGLMLTSLEGLRYLKGFYPEDRIVKELPR